LTRVANALRAGVVWENCSQPCFVEFPWGGCKKSGNGTRELGPNALEIYLEPKAIVEFVGDKLGWFDVQV